MRQMNTILRPFVDICTQALELLIPVLAAYVLVAIKNASVNEGLEAEMIKATIPEDLETFQPLTFNDYLTALQAKRICLPSKRNATSTPYLVSGISPNFLSNTFDWQVPLVKCDSRSCKEPGQDASSTACEYNIIGVSGNGVRALDFVAWLGRKYPVLSQREKFPFDFDLFRSFQSSEEMDLYVQSPNYGQYPMNPKMAMGIIFEGDDPNVYNYTLRQNSTNFNSPENEARASILTSPNTKKMLDDFAKNDNSACALWVGAPNLGFLQQSCTGQYVYNGILAFERLVNDFIIDDSGASSTKNGGLFVSEAAVQFVPFPARSYRDSGFYATLGGK
jgi:hypothetical protein